MQQVTISNLTSEVIAKLREIEPDIETRHVIEWRFPPGDAIVTVKVDGPSHRKESEILAYAVDVLEIARKHSTQ